MIKAGFDHSKYIKTQSEQIEKRINEFGGKLYLEFGGKLFDDHHASRVLPGFEPDSKVKMLQKMKDDVEIVIVINAEDIENNRMRNGIGITYDLDVLRLIDEFRGINLYVGSVVISHYRAQKSAQIFRNKLEMLGMKVYLHYPIDGYPYNVEHIVSDEGYGKNDYIHTERPLIVVTAPGAASGKMATCLSQLYHEHKRGVKAGYAKYETFPIWNLPLKHPVNIAYEAATADLNDVNMIDPYHLEAYGKTTVNYNRDVDIFPVVNTIFNKIWGESPYKSPTDMGVNMAGYCITDNDIVSKAAHDEIIRRYFNTMCERRRGSATSNAVEKIELLMKQAHLTTDDRKVVPAALIRSEQTGNQPAVAIELPDGNIITGKTSDLLGAASAALLNAVKAIGNIDPEMLLIAREAIEPIQKLKVDILGNRNPRLHTDEAMIALSISAAHDDTAKCAMNQLSKLQGCEAHSTVMLSQVDEDVFRKLGMNLTCEPYYQIKRLYHK